MTENKFTHVFSIAVHLRSSNHLAQVGEAVNFATADWLSGFAIAAGNHYRALQRNPILSHELLAVMAALQLATHHRTT